ncbi:MAG: hypothetical protein NXI21_14020 [Alphaproteobacteria bacterium]|nr:hypothetical protein [Alphaproteobacteria bacterium]
MDKAQPRRRTPHCKPGRKPAVARLFAIALVGGFAAGCDAVGLDGGIGLDALTPDEHLFQSVDEDDPRAPPATVMRFDVPTLADASSLLSTRINEDEAIFERRRVWRTADAAGVHASIVVQSRTNGREIDYPSDMREAIRLWPDLLLKNVAFGTLYQSRNALGEVLWRRFEAGGQLCVLFQQGIGPNPGEALRRVAGYYCAPAGDAFTPGQAETVVRSVRLVDQDA